MGVKWNSSEENCINLQPSSAKNSDYTGKYTQFSKGVIQLMCGDWECTSEGIKKDIVKAKGKIQTIEVSWMQITISGIIEDIETGKVKHIISFSNDDDNSEWQHIVVSPLVFSSRARILKLSNNGIPVNKNNAKYLVQYLYDLIRYNLETLPYYKNRAEIELLGEKVYFL